ncbi:hypothetical protein GCM10009835_14040 [Planosporangium flavigriseum]|uniref:Lyzozyme M1 (1,4-beta-N-acetylmuramidase), GH25 family n=2 Tax=Planosporangium flavigriseum TaxID=373681 RepID=A0A8J3LQA5_9ACTN|nr:GH25 family lysozyme [Planosporangium flavigriseum]GIG74885.1 hypothetical protein Pfl04_32890 [Planosporangium flavigriseum]
MQPCRFSAGIDASDYDWDRGPMDVAAAVRDGITFFTHKATEGTRTQHIHYGEALNRARAAGVPCMGAYLVPRTPGNNGHGAIAEQVSYFLNYLDAQTPWWRSTPQFFIQVDTEHWGYDDVAPQYGAQACDLLRSQTGKWVIHYAPRWAYGDTIPGDDPLWASSYGTNPAAPYRQAYPGDDSSGWTPYSRRTPTILQFGSRLTIGSQPSCDGDAFRGTLAQFQAMVIGGDDLMGVLIGNEPIQEYLPRIERALWWPIPGIATDVKTSLTKLDGLATAVGNIPTGNAQAPTQDQLNTAILNAMLDPRVQKGIGDAIASHIHVT